MKIENELKYLSREVYIDFLKATTRLELRDQIAILELINNYSKRGSFVKVVTDAPTFPGGYLYFNRSFINDDSVPYYDFAVTAVPSKGVFRWRTKQILRPASIHDVPLFSNSILSCINEENELIISEMIKRRFFDWST